ncbi:MAG: acetyltransferase [Microbacterium sp.]|nr:MAG: acetyltransferase [Microbacterium sp.]
MSTPGDATAVGFLGAGSQALEASDYLPGGGAPAFYAVTGPHILETRARGVGPVIDIRTSAASDLDTAVIAAVGAPGLRRDLVRSWAGTNYARVIADSARVSRLAEVHDGATIAPGAIITANASIGAHALVNVAATVAHDTRLGDYATISPGVHVAGGCYVGDGVFIGIGATISDGVVIEDGAVIGAGAVVLRDVGPQEVWVGVPARLLRHTKEWLHHV